MHWVGFYCGRGYDGVDHVLPNEVYVDGSEELKVVEGGWVNVKEF